MRREVSNLTLPCFEILPVECLPLHFVMKIKYFTHLKPLIITYNFVTSFTYPTYFTLPFFFFIGVHLDWQTLITLFLLHMEIYLILTLLHPRAQIKLLSSFYLLYLSTYLPRLNYLVRYLFSILQHEIEK